MLFLIAAAVDNIRVPRRWAGAPDLTAYVDSQLGFYPGVAEEAELCGEVRAASATASYWISNHECKKNQLFHVKPCYWG